MQTGKIDFNSSKENTSGTKQKYDGRAFTKNSLIKDSHNMDSQKQEHA